MRYRLWIGCAGVVIVAAGCVGDRAASNRTQALSSRSTVAHWKDVDWDHPIYATNFDKPDELEEWRLEGGEGMAIEDGHLVIENGRLSTKSESKGKHSVCWLTQEMPADFCLEFSVCPEDRHRGLCIVFFSARGLDGESIFDPSLASRTGSFVQYHSGDLNNYHISYWSGGRGTSNLRKNKGFYLLTGGADMIETGPAGAFQTVHVYKRDGLIRLAVDGRVAIEYTDDGKCYGPVHEQPGWIGLRQMAHTQKCEYDHLKVFPLKPMTTQP